MSWSGLVVGAPYQQPPPQAHGQPGFGHPPTYQYGQQPSQNQHQSAMYNQPGVQPRTMDNRPSKKKGNPIITKYPPPPGYRGPAQPQGPFGANSYPAPYQQYPPTQQGYPAPSLSAPYPNQGYSGYGPPIQTHTQAGHQTAPNQWPPQTPSGYSNGQYYPPPQGTYSGYPTPVTPTQASGWQQNGASYPVTGPPDSYGASAIPTPISANPSTSQHTPVSAQFQNGPHQLPSVEEGPLDLSLYDWDFDFEGAIWPKASEPVDSNFSLGQIVWHPASQVTRALPSSFAEAEAQAEKPPAEKLGNGESVSIYFTTENSHEAFLDVRQTDEWDRIKDDPAFVIFTDEQLAEFIPVGNCLALRDRPDEPIEEVDREGDTAMQDGGEPSRDVMDGLERALSGAAENHQRTGNQQDTANYIHEPGIESQTQEEILAKLGVTGKPKTPTNEVVTLPYQVSAKPPASLPPRPPVAPPRNTFPRSEQLQGRAHSYSGQRSTSYGVLAPRPYGSVSSAKPPPPVTRRSDSQSWKSTQYRPNGNAFDGARDSPTHSEGNRHPERTSNPAPQLTRDDSSFSRKRSYDDTDQDDQITRQNSDHSKRKRRSEVDAVYR